MNYDLIISHISDSTRLSQSEIDFFISILEPRKIRKKEFLLNIGDICRHDFFINSGCIKICYIDRKGNECITKFAIEDWWLTDIDSFLNQNPMFFYFQAVENTEFFQISKRNYELLHEQIPSMQKFTLERWQRSFIRLENRFIQSVSLTAEEKYHQFKQKYPNLEQRISQKLIASYLGITPEFLSVMRKKRATFIS
jgi:CRP-like cAMP-binding protein